MKEKRQPTKILVECPELIASVKVGVLEPLKRLVEEEEIQVQFKRTLDIKKKDIAWCDILVCVRGCESITLKIVEAAKKAKRYIIYFLDDDLLNLPEGLSCSAYFNDPTLKNNLVSIMKQSDMLWAVNELIIDKYKKYFNDNWVLSKVPTRVSAEITAKDNTFTRIVYAGSESHGNLVRAELVPVILKIAEEFKTDVDITFIGVDPKIRHKENIHYVKTFEEYEEYKAFVNSQGFDIGLAIIGTEEFYQCKYYNKFIEYTSIGCVGVYTNARPYTSIITDQKNGVLCSNTEQDWYAAIKLLIENKDIRMKCLREAVEVIEGEFTHEKIADNLVKDMPQLLAYRAPIVFEGQIKLYSIETTFFIDRVKFFWRNYGILCVPVIGYKCIKRLVKIFLCKKGA